MLETKFTKGEWNKTLIDLADFGIASISNESKVIAQCNLNYEITDEVKANASLISSAPDMFFALENLLSELEDCSLPSSMNFYIHNAKVALNKAVGL